MADTFARMKQLVGTTAEWAANDIVLGEGEIGVERIGVSDHRAKCGDGVKTWSQLPYLSGTAAAVDEQVAAASAHAATAIAQAATATTKAAEASDSAASAASSFDSFDDRYLGAKSSPPTVDNDGNALLTGALYWNTSTATTYLWSGTGWVNYSAPPQYIVEKVGSGTSPNYRLGINHSSIDSTLLGAWVFDGASGFANKVGINNTKPVTAPPGGFLTDTTYTSGTADYSAVMGGYDNVANGLASLVAAMHSIIYSTTTHGAIYGGSVHAIEAGEYCGVFGGLNNRITKLRSDGVTASGGSYSSIFGGSGNRATNANACIVGGLNNVADGQYSVVLGSARGKAFGDFDVVLGADNETRRGNNNAGAGSRNTIGGGRYNIIDSVTNSGASTISGGVSNESYGGFNSTGGGDRNKHGTPTVNATYGAIAGGLQNENTATNAGSIVGGRENKTTADYSAVTGGRGNIASAFYAHAHGFEANARLQSSDTIADGKFATVGDAQSSVLVRKVQTTNATQTAMGTIVLPDDSTFAFSVMIVARRTDADNESAGYRIEGVIDRNGGAGTTAMVGAPTVTVLGEDSAAWDVTASANVSSGGLGIQVTGEPSKTINWVARVTLVEVTC